MFYSKNKLIKNEEILYRSKYIIDLPKIDITDNEIFVANSLHLLKEEARKEYEKNFPTLLKTKSGLFSTKHDDNQVFFGLLGELMVAKTCGGEILARKWFNDQIQQIERIKRENIFDCKDIGNTQIRTIDWNPTQFMSIIVREKDFRSKAYQPIIGGVVCLKEKWFRIIGWLSYDDIRYNLPNDIKLDPQGRGIAYWIPPYMLKPMESFDKKYLFE